MSQMQTTPITNGEAQLARRVPRGMTGKSRKVRRVAALAEAVSLDPFGVLHPTKRDRIHQLVQVSLVYSGVRFLLPLDVFSRCFLQRLSAAGSS